MTTPSLVQGEPTLLEDLEAWASELMRASVNNRKYGRHPKADEEVNRAVRLRSAAQRLREEMVYLYAEGKKGNEYAAAALCVLDRINGGTP